MTCQGEGAGFPFSCVTYFTEIEPRIALPKQGVSSFDPIQLALVLQTLLIVINLLTLFYHGLLPWDQIFPAELLMQLEASSFPPKMTLLISSRADDTSLPSEF